MDMGVPAWLTPLAWAYLIVAVACAVVVVVDIYGRGYRQERWSMEGVWVIAALYLGPVALFLYSRFGRPHTERWQQENGRQPRVRTGHALRGGLQGGAASAVAHVIAVPLVVWLGWTIAGMALWATVAVITALAIGLLFVLEYSMLERRVAAGRAVGLAVVLATITVLFFDVGMLGWMLGLHFSGFMPPPSDVTFVFLMQMGTVLGLITAYPAIAWLLSRQLKVAV